MGAAFTAGAGDCFDLPGFVRNFVAGSSQGWGGGHRGRRGGPWGGPGAGGWGGFGGGWPGGGRPRAGRGDVRSALLALLAEQPMHGYQMIQEIVRRSGGSWKPSPGSVYPTLQQLEDEGLVRASEQEGRRVFSLTEAGQELAKERAAEFASLWEGVSPSDDDAQLGDLVFQVGAAFVQVARTGTPEQLDAARQVLARTRADLYRILGDDAAVRNDNERA